MITSGDVTWDGAFSPVRKHRDYRHSTFLEHELDNGGRYEIQKDDWVMVDTDPIDESPFEPSRRYYAVDFTLHEGSWYRFLVPAEPDLSEPEWDNIRDTLEQYFRNPVDGGRDWVNYIDAEATPTEHMVRLFETEENVPEYRTRSTSLMLEGSEGPM